MTHALFHCELVSLHVYLLWSSVINNYETVSAFARSQIISYWLLCIFLHFKEYISLWYRSITSLFTAVSFSPWKSVVTFRTMDNWCYHCDHYVNVCKKKNNIKNSSRQQTRFPANVSKLQRLWSTETPNLNSIHISFLHFSILKKKTNVHSHPMLEKQRQQEPGSNWQWEIHSETGRNWSVWTLLLQAPLDVSSRKKWKE